MHTSVHPNHACLEILEQPPGAIYVLREEVACKSHLYALVSLSWRSPSSSTHAGIVCLLDYFILRVKLIECQNRCKCLLPRNEHLFLGSNNNGRLKEVPSGVSDLATSQDDPAAVLLCILNLRKCLVKTAGRGDGSHCSSLGSTMANNELAGLFRQHVGEFFVDSLLHINTIRRDTSLTCMTPFQEHERYSELALVWVYSVEDRLSYPQALGGGLRHRR
jgi:hypothetical protein